MGSITFNPVEEQTKPCLFCAEMIQAAAIKCRFCGEFLNSEKAKRLEREAAGDFDDDEDIFVGRPSLFGMVGAVIRGAFFMGVGVLLMHYRLEEFSMFQALVELSESQAMAFGEWRVLAGEVLVGLVLLILMMQAINLKCIRYKVSAERIEWSRGILDRRVDNLDMFRVVDISMRRSLLDCIFGIGTVGLVTTDKNDPEFTFRKVRYPRGLYDIIKKASLDADKRDGVIHLE